MKLYLKINDKGLETFKAMRALKEAQDKGWQDYLILPSPSGFNVLRNLGELLSDPNHVSKAYNIFNDRGRRTARPKVFVTGNKAIIKDLTITWSEDANVISFYYRDDSDLDYVEKLGLKNPILIKCPTY